MHAWRTKKGLGPLEGPRGHPVAKAIRASQVPEIETGSQANKKALHPQLEIPYLSPELLSTTLFVAL